MVLASKANKTEPQSLPGEKTSILRKVSAIGTPSTLVFGLPGTGKSTLIKELLLKSQKNPLWLPLNNSGALATDERVAGWDTAAPSDWKEMLSAIYKPALSGELSGYNAIVIDGLNVLMGYSLSAQAPSGVVEQSDWLKASNSLRDILVKLREKFGELYAVVDVTTEAKTGARKLDLNPYSKQVLVPLFGNKWYTAFVKERDAKNALTGNYLYTVQRHPSLALDFTNGQPVTLDTAE